MAIRTSNQITFTEQKKIIELKEWYLATSLEDGVTRDTEGWTTDAQSVNPDQKYLWNYEEVIYSIGESDVSDPVIIGMYGTGADGKGITDILNYYSTTQEPELPEPIPDNFWKDNKDAIKELSSINKYLWNYERVLYTDGTSKPSEPMIIGVYGDSGEDAITFQIYSPSGFEFIDSIDEDEQVTAIELKVAAFKGGDTLTEATYTWSYWDGVDTYVDIITTTETLFVVHNTDSYALSNLKCTMLYDNKTYEDYVTLSTKLDTYSASIKFFNGTNVFSQTQEYLIGYIDLYKNNKLEEHIITDDYYIGISSVDHNTNIITTDYEGDDTQIYFICSNDNEYEIVLGEHNGTEWHVVDSPTKYIYQNDIDLTTTSNVFLVSKRDIGRTRDVNVYVYTQYIIDENGNTTTVIDVASMIATTHVTITDLNDVIFSSTEPTDAYEKQLWFDTGDNILKIYSDGQWVSAAKQKKGQDTYTVKPDSYEVDDLWIVSKDDAFDEFTEGSIWMAVQNSDENGFNAEHWSDAVPEITKLQNNVNYFFDMNPSTGLKISNNSDRFYVRLTSSKMSFCENPDIIVPDEEIQEEYNPHEVVHIGNKSATIKNLVVEGNADINCTASIDKEVNIINTYDTKTKYPGFTWQVEPDGGFSLVKMEVK